MITVLTAVVLDIIDSDVGGYKWSAIVFFLVPLFCQKFGFRLLCKDDVLYLGTGGEITDTSDE